MAVKSDPEVTAPESTDVVGFDDSPITTDRVADNKSTGAVKYDDEGLLGETANPDYHEDSIEVRQKTPGPVETVVHPFAAPQAKVVASDDRQSKPQAANRARTK